jgi:exopolyphosphatase/guanosine-5'-triphosphate,3'-diphosphate pyrophosphatase
VQIAIIDVGSNTARLLVAEVTPEGSVLELAQEGVHLALAEELLRGGTLAPAKIDEVVAVVSRFATLAGKHDPVRTEAIVTAPGRGPSGPALARAVQTASGWPTRILSADEEGRLAYDGAVARHFVAQSHEEGGAEQVTEVVAVVDVGGGSSEIVVGTPLLGAAWVRSLTTGSLHMTRLLLASDPPAGAEVAAARDAVRRALEGVEPPQADVALAAGGSARAVGKVIGRIFGPDDLDEVIRIATRRPAADVAQTFRLRERRAETLVAGAIVLAETSRLLNRPFELARGGLREGAALAVAASAAAAAA